MHVRGVEFKNLRGSGISMSRFIGNGQFRFVQILLLLTILAGVLIPQSISLSASIIFFPVVILVLGEIAQHRFSLIAAFLIGVAYMILPEAILSEEVLSAQWGEGNVIIGYRVIMLSTISLCIGYFLLRKKFDKKREGFTEIVLRRGSMNVAWGVFAFLEIVQVILFAPYIASGFSSGRGGELAFNVGLFGYFLRSIQYAILAFWGYYYSRENRGWLSMSKALLLAFPLFLIGVASGTRFYLCFQLMCLLAPWIRVLNFKKILWGGVGVLLLVSVFTSMKATRYSGFEFLSISQIVGSQDSSRGLTRDNSLMRDIAGLGSIEGVVRNMAMINLYTTTHDYTYGKSIAFLGIFWIPRFIWEDKPTQLDHWLIREYEDERKFGKGYSTASSFCGELFMDFGYFCIVVCFGLGVVLAKMDVYVETRVLRGDFYSTFLCGLFLGWALFMTRSMLTASFQVVLGVLVAFFLTRVLLRERVVKKHRRSV